MNCYEDLKDKKVLVTGASRGIGAGIVKAFSNAGAKVFLHYRTDHQIAHKAVASGSQVTEVRSLFGNLVDEVKIHLNASLVSNGGKV